MKVLVQVYKITTEKIDVEVDIPNVPMLDIQSQIVDFASVNEMAEDIAIERVKQRPSWTGTVVGMTYEAGMLMIKDEKDE